MPLQAASPYTLGLPAPADIPSKASTRSATQDYDVLQRLIRDFEAWAWSTEDERLLAQRDRDYYDHKQLTAEQIKVLRKRGQPDVVINKIVTKINYLKGMERRLRSDPKAFPRNPVDEPDSDAATQVLRYIADDNAYDQKRSSVSDNMLIEGIGGVDNVAEVQPDGSVDIKCHHIPYERIWWDPHAQRGDFTDARYIGTMTWMDRDEVEELYPDSGDAVSSTLEMEDDWSTFSDKPRTMQWADASRKRVMIAQAHYREKGDWWTATFTRSAFLSAPVVSPYLDRFGKTAPSLRLRSLYIDRDNAHFGAVRQYIGMQDEVNARRSRAMHMFNTRQIKLTDGVVDDVDKTRAELSKPDGVVVVNPMPDGKLEILPTGDMASGQLELLRQVTAEFEIAGPNASLQGKDPREQSGRAIQAQQQGGAVEYEPFVDAVRQFNRQNYEAWWMTAKQFWSDEKTIAVTDEESNTDWVTLNHPVTVAEALSRLPDDVRAQTMQAQGFQPGDPRLQQVLKIENNISDLDVKITVEDGPDISTLQSEQSNWLAQQPDIPLKIRIKYSNLPKKSEMLKDLEEIQQQQAQAAAAAQQHEMAMAQAKIGLLQAQTTLAQSNASLKGADAASRVHDMALDHAYVTAPDNAPAGHEMALANVTGADMPTAPVQPNPQVQQQANAMMPPPGTGANNPQVFGMQT